MKKVEFGGNEVRIFQATPEDLRAQFSMAHIRMTTVQPRSLTRTHIDPNKFLNRIPTLGQGPQDLYPRNNPEEFTLEELGRQPRNAAIGHQLAGDTSEASPLMTVIDLTKPTEQPPIHLERKIKQEEEVCQELQTQQQALVIQPGLEEAESMFMPTLNR